MVFNITNNALRLPAETAAVGFNPHFISTKREKCSSALVLELVQLSHLHTLFSNSLTSEVLPNIPANGNTLESTSRRTPSKTVSHSCIATASFSSKFRK